MAGTGKPRTGKPRKSRALTNEDGSPKRGPGRPKGAQNKITVSIREMIEGAMDKLGGAAYLEKCAQEQPSAFLALVGKIIPVQVQSATELSGSITIGWKSPKACEDDGKK